MSNVISFEQDAKLANELLDILSREQTNLIAADIDAMEVLLEEKGILLNQINETMHNRYQSLKNSGFDPNEEGMMEWIKLQDKPSVRQAWILFQKTLTQAKQMNRVNGLLITKHFNNNQQKLNWITGNSNPGVYGSNGKTTSQSYLRSGISA